MGNLTRILPFLGSAGAIAFHLTVGKVAVPVPVFAADQRTALVAAAAVDMVGIQEKTGNNDGPEVGRILATVGLPEGWPYCGATNYAAYLWAGEKLPGKPSDYAWSPTWSRPLQVVWNQSSPWTAYQFRPADTFTLYYPNLKRVGHTGVVIGQEGMYLITVEGNTNPAGSREGQGVYIKRRNITQVHNITRWIPYAPATASTLH